MPEGSRGFEAVYTYIVPAERRTELANVGIIGGISMAVRDPDVFFLTSMAKFARPDTSSDRSPCLFHPSMQYSISAFGTEGRIASIS